MMKKIKENDLSNLFLSTNSHKVHWSIYYILLIVGLSASLLALFLTIKAESFFGLNYFFSEITRWTIIFILIIDFLNIPGFINFKHIPTPKLSYKNSNNKLIVQFTSRGDNLEVLRDSASTSYQILSDLNYDFKIRLVTSREISNLLSSDEKSNYELVYIPEDYICPNGSLYKARGLEYARTTCLDSDNVWILFMDEESILTESSARGVINFIENDLEKNLIGQGLITYTGRKFGKLLSIASAEAKRAGFNIGKYFFQYNILNDVYFGFQGSYFVTSSKVINEVGFDFGPRSSLTEDIFFAFLASKKGIRFRWINGHVREQAAESIYDFLRQRRRWIQGSRIFLLDGRIPFNKKIILLSTIIPYKIWSIIPFIVFLNLENLHKLGNVSNIQIILAGLYYAALNPSFLIGMLYTVVDSSLKTGTNKVLLSLMFIFSSPLGVILEHVATIYSLVTIEKGFSVVKKSR